MIEKLKRESERTFKTYDQRYQQIKENLQCNVPKGTLKHAPSTETLLMKKLNDSMKRGALPRSNSRVTLGAVNTSLSGKLEGSFERDCSSFEKDSFERSKRKVRVLRRCPSQAKARPPLSDRHGNIFPSQEGAKGRAACLGTHRLLHE